MNHGDRLEGTNLLQKEADAGNPSAAYWLYALSSELEDPEAQAIAERSLVRAADLGHVYARRDLARRRMKVSRDFGSKLGALIDYWRAGASAIALMIKDVNDRRVR